MTDATSPVIFVRRRLSLMFCRRFSLAALIHSTVDARDRSDLSATDALLVFVLPCSSRLPGLETLGVVGHSYPCSLKTPPNLDWKLLGPMACIMDSRELRPRYSSGAAKEVPQTRAVQGAGGHIYG
mmetsp:Transcript_28451/g.55365  ORF Transcript_28451/g.55365 Transcript_28451/m.55365 type:complete len:126 (+) Transcript_28451:934-1311(+)